MASAGNELESTPCSFDSIDQNSSVDSSSDAPDAPDCIRRVIYDERMTWLIIHWIICKWQRPACKYAGNEIHLN